VYLCKYYERFDDWEVIVYIDVVFVEYGIILVVVILIGFCCDFGVFCECVEWVYFVVCCIGCWLVVLMIFWGMVV